jgi:hypothetical protein
MSARKSHQAETKYCSARCRGQKPKALDRKIEDAFVALLNGDANFQGELMPENLLPKKGQKKGEKGFLIPCSAAETLVFGSRLDPNKTHGRKRNKAPRALKECGEWKSVDMESGEEEDDEMEEPEHLTVGFAGKVRPPQHLTDVNGGIGGEKGRAERVEETENDARKRREGQRVADEREMVKRAARRGVVFGFEMKAGNREHVQSAKGCEKGQQLDISSRKCEAVMNGAVVEPSFAKGDWSIRWRES